MATFNGHCTGFSYLFFSLSLPEWLDLQDCFYIGSAVGGEKMLSPQHACNDKGVMPCKTSHNKGKVYGGCTCELLHFSVVLFCSL